MRRVVWAAGTRKSAAPLNEALLPAVTPSNPAPRTSPTSRTHRPHPTPTPALQHEVTQVEEQAHVALVAARSYTTTWVNISIPRAATPLLPTEPGYSLPGLKNGFSADAFQKQLAADSKHLELKRRRQQRRRVLLLQEQEQLQSDEEWEGQEEGLRRGAFAEEEGEEEVDSADEAGWGQRQRRQLLQSEAAEGAVSLPHERRAMERLAYAADWLIGGWPQRGALGLWDPLLTSGKQRQVRSVGGEEKGGEGRARVCRGAEGARSAGCGCGGG